MLPNPASVADRRLDLAQLAGGQDGGLVDHADEEAGPAPAPAGRKTVLMVLESMYPSTDGGGAESQVETLTANRPDGVDVVVVAPLVAEGSQKTEERVHGCRVIRLAYPRWPLIGGIVMLLRLAFLIIAWRCRIDAVHCHIAHNMAAVACLIGRMLAIPVVVKPTGMTELEGGILTDRPGTMLRLKRWMVRQATAIHAISEKLETALIDKGFEPERIHRIPNAVDTGLFAPADDLGRSVLRARFCIESAFTACFVGRLAPEKALDSLMRAWADAIPSEASASLLLVGSGPIEDELKRLADDLGRRHQIRFEGFVADKRIIADYWRIADLGLLTSDFEGLSNALLEAMASAVPMIGSRVSGNADLIQPGRTGWLVTPRAEDQLAAALSAARALPEDERRALGVAARQSALSLVGVERVWERLLPLYERRHSRSVPLCAE